MKRILFMGLTVTTLLFSNLSQAAFTFHSSMPNACQDIAGQWSGKGKATNWLIGDCVYHGSGSTSTINATGNFTVKVSVDKDSGNFLCPKHVTQQLTGVCTNGNVTIKTEYGNLKGSFSQTGGNAKGTLSVAPGMDADVTMQFQRVG